MPRPVGGVINYWSIFLMVELDAKRFGAKNIETSTGESVWVLMRRYWYHFSSLIGIALIAVVVIWQRVTLKRAAMAIEP